MKPAIEVEGLTALRKGIKSLGDTGLVSALKDANRSSAQVVVARALPNVPVRTGKLKSTVKALAAQRDARVQAGSAKTSYAAAVHWGRKKGNVGSPPGNHPGKNVMAGRMFLWDAAQASLAEATAKYEQEIERLLDTIRGGR